MQTFTEKTPAGDWGTPPVSKEDASNQRPVGDRARKNRRHRRRRQLGGKSSPDDDADPPLNLARQADRQAKGGGPQARYSMPDTVVVYIIV